MKPPAFWTKPYPTVGARLLRPAGMLYGKLTSLRAQKSAKWAAPIPVICVGNLSLGGTGKTPCVLSLGRFFQEQGKRPFILSRGYGGTVKGPVQVCDQASRHVGDEPLLLSQYLPVVVSKDRVAGAQMCVEKGADLILMDDGFQNPDLFKDVSFCVIDGGVGFGNALPFPAGPLREPIEQGLERAQGVILIGEDVTGVKERILKLIPDMMVFHVRMKPRDETLDKTCPYVAFAGIGRPEKFYQTLREHAINLVATQDFADHQDFNAADLKRLYHLAETQGAQLICTEKDWMRLDAPDREKIISFKIGLEWSKQDLLKPLMTSLFDRD